MKKFVGMSSWYRSFISDFLFSFRRLTTSLKEAPVCFLDESRRRVVFGIKDALVSAPILISSDFSLFFTIQSDASASEVGGVLPQVHNYQDKAIAYASRSLSRAERNYSVTERQLLYM